MSEDLHNIDDLFRKALEQNQELPAASVWDNIDKTLDKKKVVSISKKYNKLKWAAAVLLLFSIGMAMYTLHIRQQNKALVQQNKVIRNTGKQKIDNEITSKDSSTASTTNQAPLFRNKLENHKKNNDSTFKNTNIEVTVNSGVANKTVNEQQNPITKNQHKTEQPETETEDVVMKNQIDPSLKNSAGFKMKVEKEISDSPDNITNKDTRNLLSDKNSFAQTEVKNNSVYHNVTNRQKNIETPELAPEIKNDFPLSTQKPETEIDKILQQQSIALENKKISSAKRSKINSSARSPFSITGFFSPDIVSTSLKDEHPRFREEERNAIEKDEQIKFSSTFGVLLDYTIGKKWKLESGITYSTRKTAIQPKTIYARPDNDGNINYRFNCSAGYSYVTVESSPPPTSGDSINALASTNNLQYIGLPLYAKYIFTTGRFSILPGAGISFNFLTKGKIETTIATSTGTKNPSINNIEGLKPMYLNGAAGIRVQYKLNKTISLSFEPAFRFALSPINKDASVKTNLNSLGLSTGLVFKL
ncbi:PorT family protein [Ginsengibacter hankyongi]|uniref:PorT family protein n=1 Tax=Ginsengibacter hankyongi TaxID=2607284 RepID=A0A5J5IH60_9BACT|nr:outer membrane beta-barrel protein [Ginsengibacter hankyongi]KAA9039401.1 PorT family protein [Ginsengibacter hankyongi]